MATKLGITRKFALEYAAACKKTRGRMLDELVARTERSRANAHRQVNAAVVCRGPQRPMKQAHRPRTDEYDALKLLIGVWTPAGQPSGKYLDVSALLDLLGTGLTGSQVLEQERLTFVLYPHRRVVLCASLWGAS